MKLGILSDTHNKLAAAETALQLLADNNVDLVIHCGDWTSYESVKAIKQQARKLGLLVKGVFGNNDKSINQLLSLVDDDFSIYKETLQLSLEGQIITAYHGHHKPTLNMLMEEDYIDVLLLGHSHKPRNEKLGKKLIVNPGSVAFSIPRRKDWKPSVAIYDTTTSLADIIYFEIQKT